MFSRPFLLMPDSLTSTICVTDDYRKYSLAYALGVPYVKRISKVKAQ
jgi:hypothetical protein